MTTVPSCLKELVDILPDTGIILVLMTCLTSSTTKSIDDWRQSGYKSNDICSAFLYRYCCLLKDSWPNVLEGDTLVDYWKIWNISVVQYETSLFICRYSVLNGKCWGEDSLVASSLIIILLSSIIALHHLIDVNSTKNWTFHAIYFLRKPFVLKNVRLRLNKWLLESLKCWQ